MTSTASPGRVPRILVAQIGARRHYAVVRALARAGLLERLVTDACANIAPWSWLDRALPERVRPPALRRLLGRVVEDVPADKIRGLPMFALSSIWDGGRGAARVDVWTTRNAAFCSRVVGAGFGAADAVYAYNGAAREIFLAAKERGLATILDQTAAPWRWNARLLREEAERWPGWEDEPAETDVSGRLSEREEAEWALADRIVCGSEFAAGALAETGGPRERCEVVPYAASQMSAPLPRSRREGDGLRVLFVGTLQLRKGPQYIPEAVRLLGNERVHIRFVGPWKLSDRALKALGEVAEVVGPVPRAAISEHYDWADVFLLPTLSEGSANVIYEAMAQGLPVITTPNAGSIVEDGREGFIVPIRDPAAMAAAMLKLAGDRELRARMAAAALATAKQASLEIYARRLVDGLALLTRCGARASAPELANCW